MTNRRDQLRRKKKAEKMKQQKVTSPPPSILDQMKDGEEYKSIVGRFPAGIPISLLSSDFTRALSDMAAIRRRPVVAYFGDMQSTTGMSGIDPSDTVPFDELVCSVPAGDSIDVLVSTPGGSGAQVQCFVDSLRNRFKRVEFLLPYFCMSAGTLLALSGDEIWMSSRARLGPIDPQMRLRNGQYFPAQSLWTLIFEINQLFLELDPAKVQQALAYIRLLDNIDPNQLASLLAQTEYVNKMAIAYLENYKLKSWVKTETRGATVTAEMRQLRAKEIAVALANHSQWKDHGHRISREAASSNLVNLKIRSTEENPDLDRAIRRVWALAEACLNDTNIIKVFASSSGYFLARMEMPPRQTEKA